MREIKFRYWNKVEGVFYQQTDGFEDWSSGQVLSLDFSARTITTEEEDFEGDVVSDKPLNDFDMQMFTGIKDESDKEIFDGDIIKDDEGTTYSVGWDDYGQWYAYDVTNNGNWSMSLGELNKACQVVGNIYQNPELLTP